MSGHTQLTVGLTIRTADPLRDYPKVAELRSLVETLPMTAADLVALDGDVRKGQFTRRIVAEIDGHIVATGHAVHTVWHPPGVFRIAISTDPARVEVDQSAILDHLEQVAVEQGATEFEVRVRENNQTDQRYFEQKGYRSIATSFESVLDTTTFESENFSTRPPQGIRYFAFSETEMGEEYRRKLWDLNTETSLDEPMNDPTYRPTFEEFNGSVIDASWFDPSGQFLAAIGEDWIAISAVGQAYAGTYYNLFTGVRRGHRGKGLAKALKVLATQYARSKGAMVVRTNNDSRNAPMLAINAALGYKPEPGWIVYRKAVS